MAFKLHDDWDNLVFATNYNYRVATEEDLVCGTEVIMADKQNWLQAWRNPILFGYPVTIVEAPVMLTICGRTEKYLHYEHKVGIRAKRPLSECMPPWENHSVLENVILLIPTR